MLKVLYEKKYSFAKILTYDILSKQLEKEQETIAKYVILNYYNNPHMKLLLLKLRRKK